jgi:RHS repeat-associated protein
MKCTGLHLSILLWLSSTPFFGAEARYFDARTSRFLSIDSKVHKYPFISPYAYSLNNPLKFVDPTGTEPVKAGIGSADGVAGVLKRVPLNPEGTLLLAKENNTNPFLMTADGQKNRYIPTENGKFIDMLHFTKAAAEVYSRSEQGDWLLEQVTKGAMVIGVQLAGLWTEVTQAFDSNPDTRHSAFSGEDIPSNFLGAAFGAVFDPNKPLYEQMSTFLLNSGAITKDQYKQLYPDAYKSMPESEKDARERYKQKNPVVNNKNTTETPTR